MSNELVLKGVRVHNLKNIDLTIPRDQLVVLTGLSGSGKSSLAFDTIYAEGHRRFVESLSSYARMSDSWISRISIRSRGCRPRSRSTRRPPPKTRALRWAR